MMDFGNEVHLWVEQRVPWTVALKILRLLTDPDPPAEGEGSGLATGAPDVVVGQPDSKKGPAVVSG